MRFEKPLLRGVLLKRRQRFLADVRLADGTQVTAHCPNSGSMLGCLVPGSPVRLSESRNPRRRLPYTWEMVRVGRTWVGINTQWPNRLVEEALGEGRIPELAGYGVLRREVPVGEGCRMDLLLRNGRECCYVEVKNVTLASEGVALFPDAVTQRGTRHLRVLMDMAARGHRAVMLYVVQREDCQRFRPAQSIDPQYARTLREAVASGVEVLVYRARVRPQGIHLERSLAWDLDCREGRARAPEG